MLTAREVATVIGIAELQPTRTSVFSMTIVSRRAKERRGGFHGMPVKNRQHATPKNILSTWDSMVEVAAETILQSTSTLTKKSPVQPRSNVTNMAHRKTTSRRVATKASKLLRSGRSSARLKSVAASALSQKHGRGRR